MKTGNIKNGVNSAESLHAVGNGKVCCYSNGPEINQIFGPFYSSPSFLKMSVCDNIEYSGQREEKTCIWHHSLKKNGKDIGRFTEFCSADTAVYIRDYNLTDYITWDIKLIHDGEFIECDSMVSPDYHAVFARIPAGTFLYVSGDDYGAKRGYPVLKSQTVVICFKKSCEYKIEESSLILNIKKSPLYLCFSETDPNAFEICSNAITKGTDWLLKQCRERWQAFTQKRLANMTPLNKSKYNEEILKACDDIAVLIAAQQGEQGGVLAGNNYHLGYVRDQYGVLRGLLSMGCYDNAKLLVDFYYNIFKQYGYIKNAQGIGCEAFHQHEDDNAEITGYLILTVLDYYDYTGDSKTVLNVLPMLIWAADRQAEELCSGMLPFNGDETYIAGGVIPRSVISQGSAESTLLFHRSSEKVLQFIAKYKCVSDEFIKKLEFCKKQIEEKYAGNFITDNVLYCNQPSLNTLREAPAYRHGVRECGHGFGWTFKNKNGRYVCLRCIDKDIEPVNNDRYYIHSVGFVPSFLGTKLIPSNVIDPSVQATINEFLKKGYLSSSPDGNYAVGYDSGLLLNTLTEEQKDIADMLFEYNLSLRDDTGAWCEYYIEKKPTNTRCRPWESAINIFALLNANNKFYK